jgi:hypothetical protein
VLFSSSIRNAECSSWCFRESAGIAIRHAELPEANLISRSEEARHNQTADSSLAFFAALARNSSSRTRLFSE